MNYRDLINLKDYPIDTPNELLDQIIASARKRLEQDGCVVLKDFLTPCGIKALKDEADRTAPKAHRSCNRTNVYFTKDDPSLPKSHPKRRFYDRSNAFIAADNFKSDGALRNIHNATGFDAFIQNCLQEENFHRYADPLADVIINTANQGNGFPWHFDTNNFTVTLAIQNADKGGAFEYAPHIRDKDGNENFDRVEAVLDGTSDEIVSLRLEPGDLQLFRGRYSLHRVSPLEGDTPRHVAILSYVKEPNMVASPERCQQLYGRTLPIHHARVAQRSDTYLD